MRAIEYFDKSADLYPDRIAIVAEGGKALLHFLGRCRGVIAASNDDQELIHNTFF